MNVTDGSGRTPVHLAVERGNLDVLTNLIQRGARLNERDGRGWTPLHHAASRGDNELIGYLLEKGHWTDDATRGIPSYYGYAHISLAQAEQQLGNEEAVQENLDRAEAWIGLSER